MKKYFVLLFVLAFCLSSGYAYYHHGYYEQWKVNDAIIYQVGPTAPLSAAYGRTFARVDAWVDAFQHAGSYARAIVNVHYYYNATGYIEVSNNINDGFPGASTTFYNVSQIETDYTYGYGSDFWMTAFRVNWYYDWDY